MLEDGWSTEGAQEFPFGVVIVNNTTIASVIEHADAFYIGGSVPGQSHRIHEPIVTMTLPFQDHQSPVGHGHFDWSSPGLMCLILRTSIPPLL